MFSKIRTQVTCGPFWWWSNKLDEMVQHFSSYYWQSIIDIFWKNDSPTITINRWGESPRRRLWLQRWLIRFSTSSPSRTFWESKANCKRFPWETEWIQITQFIPSRELHTLLFFSFDNGGYLSAIRIRSRPSFNYQPKCGASKIAQSRTSWVEQICARKGLPATISTDTLWLASELLQSVSMFKL